MFAQTELKKTRRHLVVLLVRSIRFDGNEALLQAVDVGHKRCLASFT